MAYHGQAERKRKDCGLTTFGDKQAPEGEGDGALEIRPRVMFGYCCSAVVSQWRFAEHMLRFSSIPLY